MYLQYRRINELRERTGAGSAVFDDPRNQLTVNEELALTLVGPTVTDGVEGAVRVVHPDFIGKQFFHDIHTDTLYAKCIVNDLGEIRY